MDPDRVQAVVDWPTPDSRKALQRFLDCANFYRRFIRSFSQLAAPLTALTSIKTPFRWSSAAEAAFTKLKGCFVSAPILIAPDPSRQFVVEVDVSERQRLLSLTTFFTFMVSRQTWFLTGGLSLSLNFGVSFAVC